MSETEVLTLNTAAEVEKNPQGVVRRWLAELGMADRAEKEWRDEAKNLWDLYEGGKKKAHSFNIFWSNTETLLPAIYNSQPEPDVRRRFRDADPIGKAVSELLERTLSYQVDDYDFNDEAESFVLDMLVTGRGVPRVKYEPRFMAQEMEDATEAAGGDDPEGEEDSPEKLAGESVECEAVQWDDFRRGPGKRWQEVPWVGFRHDFTQEMAEDKFGEELAARLTYTEGTDSQQISEDKQTREIFKTVEVWEFWDKDNRRVLFIAPSFRDGPLFEADDPLKLKGFFPCPRPAHAIKQTRSLVPIPLYRLYKEQAKELDRVSVRINKIVEAMRLRGAYSANLSEMAGIIEAGDNVMTPVSNMSEIASIGGLDKGIWMMPIDKLKAVLDGLYLARNEIKQAIYEITGLSDIIRGSTNAAETASAQKLKSQWGSLRLQRMQREVQRVIRDVLRLKAEVIAERFTPETFEQVTGLDFPTQVEQQQAQMVAMGAQQMGQPPPPELLEVLEKPTWEAMLQVMRNDGLRSYRVDVETDSTVAETVTRDMEGLREVIASVGEVLAGIQQGLPVEVAKEVALSVVRRARLGSAVEDALQNFEAPPAADPTADIEGVKTQIMEIVKQAGAKTVQADMAAQEQQAQTQQIGQVVQQVGPAVEQLGQTAVMGMQELAARQDQQAQMLAQIGQSLQAMQSGQGEALQGALGQVAQAFDAVLSGLQQVAQGMQTVGEMVAKPKRVRLERDPETTKIIGATSESVQ